MLALGNCRGLHPVSAIQANMAGAHLGLQVNEGFLIYHIQ
jgi:hypothetical protein